MKNEKNQKLVTIYEAPDAARAELIRQILANEGIEAQVTGEHQGGLVGLNIMKIEVVILESDVKAAKVIIEHAESQ